MIEITPALAIGATLLIAIGIHWRRLRRTCISLASMVPAAWHSATEYRFQRLAESAAAADTLLRIQADTSVNFRKRLAHVDDTRGGYMGAADMIARSIAQKRFSLWELERYCEALGPDAVRGGVSPDIAQRCEAYLPPIKQAKEEAERQVSHQVSSKRALATQDFVSKQLWIGAVSALAAALAAVASLATVLSNQ